MKSFPATKINRRDFVKLAGLTAAGSALLPKPLLAGDVGTVANTAADPLVSQFINPPAHTRLRCYWYWMDGHVSKEGITRDLEAMQRLGIGEPYIGIIGDGQSGMPNGEMKVLTEEFWDAMEHAIREAGRLGMNIGVFNSPGWSQSGGPWVTPQQSMRYVSQMEIRLHSPQKYSDKLPEPKGEFQDIKVLAFPAPAGDTNTLAAHSPKVSGDPQSGLTYEVAEPFTARSLKITPLDKLNVTAELLVSEDGQTYRSIRKFTMDRHNLGIQVGPLPLAPVTVSFPAATARFFRLQFSAACQLGEIEFSAAARVENCADKQLQKVFQDPHPPAEFYMWPPQVEPESENFLVQPTQVQDISSHLASDGMLNWDVPAGEWIVQRVVALPTGTTNSPAPPEATGLEVDKMSREHLREHFDAYIGKLLKRMPADERKAWKHVIADSFETGPQNWTDDFIADFKSRYGYNPVIFFPVLSGRLVGSADQSDRFLWDLRRMVADRIAKDYVGGLRDLSHEHGLRMWLENYGHWGFPSEFLKYGGSSDEVAGEFWAGTGFDNTLELRAASSAAHTCGSTVVWSEAFTGGPAFEHTPRDIKALGDWAFCQGINQYVLHVYIHQPWEDKFPGVNAWFGTEFNRHNTWFEKAKPWVDYLRRCTVLLQSGKPVADVAYFIGEDAPKMTGTLQPELPAGYDFDYINADVIENRLQVKDGRFILPDGTSYRVLVLPPQDTMRPELLAAIRKLVVAGGIVLGPPPKRSPSNQNFPRCDEKLRELAGEMWLAKSVGQGRVFHDVNLTEVMRQIGTPPDVECPEGILWKHRRVDDLDIYFISNQRLISRTETISLRVANRTPELWWPESGRIESVAFDLENGRVRMSLPLEPAGSVFVVFRRKPTENLLAKINSKAGGLEIRHAVYGTEDAVVAMDVTAQLAAAVLDGQSNLLANNTTFGYDPAYQKAKFLRVEYIAGGKPGTIIVPENEWLCLSTGTEISGAWEVSFNPKFGGTDKPVTFARLEDWTKRSEPGIKYYSGTAIYRKSIELISLGKPVWLNLGTVNSLATVRLNGMELGTLWKPPYKLDISQAAKLGINQLEIEVVNTWLNRLIGDEQPGMLTKITFVTHKGWDANSKLLPAGLVGPVTLNVESPS